MTSRNIYWIDNWYSLYLAQDLPSLFTYITYIIYLLIFLNWLFTYFVYFFKNLIT